MSVVRALALGCACATYRLVDLTETRAAAFILVLLVVMCVLESCRMIEVIWRKDRKASLAGWGAGGASEWCYSALVAGSGQGNKAHQAANGGEHAANALGLACGANLPLWRPVKYGSIGRHHLACHSPGPPTTPGGYRFRANRCDCGNRVPGPPPPNITHKATSLYNSLSHTHTRFTRKHERCRTCLC